MNEKTTNNIKQLHDRPLTKEEARVEELAHQKIHEFYDELAKEGLLHASRGTVEGSSDAVGKMGLEVYRVEGDISDRAMYSDKVHPEGRYERDELARKANTDKLTELPNRHVFEEATEVIPGGNGLENRKASGGRSILLIDVNNFKAINDTFSHAVGDRVLQYIAEQLRQTVKGVLAPDEKEFHASNVFRVGGDEFAILCNPTEAVLLKDRITEEFGTLFLEDSPVATSNGKFKLEDGSEVGYTKWGDTQVSLSVGIGDTTVEADKKMYDIKEQIKKVSPTSLQR